MTREEIEILNMNEGKEIDRLIAKKITHINNGIFQDSYIEGVLEWFNPSTNMSDAWQVVEKLKEYEFLVRQNKNGSATVVYGKAFRDNVTSLTAPLAICKAALLTKVSK